MTRKYKNKTCVYCTQDGASKTGDHIFAREFFLERQRANLPQVPACDACNGEKAKLEHYLTAVLPFAGRHGDAAENLSTMVPRRLQNNLKLQRQLAESFREITAKDDSGLAIKSASFGFDYEKFRKLLEYAVRGLTWHYFDSLIPKEHFVGILLPNLRGSEVLAAPFAMQTEKRVQKRLGNDTIVVEGVQSESEPLTCWKICFYAGLKMAEGATQQQGGSWFFGLAAPQQPDWWPKQ